MMLPSGDFNWSWPLRAVKKKTLWCPSATIEIARSAMAPAWFESPGIQTCVRGRGGEGGGGVRGGCPPPPCPPPPPGPGVVPPPPPPGRGGGGGGWGGGAFRGPPPPPPSPLPPHAGLDA